jgi:hypothetical protein
MRTEGAAFAALFFCRPLIIVMRLVIKKIGSDPQVEPVGTPPQTTIGGAISGAGYKNRNTAGLEDEDSSEEEMIAECDCGCPMCSSGEHHPEHDIEYHYHDDDDEYISDEEQIEIMPASEKLLVIVQEAKKKKKKKKGDRCVRIARRKYHKWPSAYASGAVVKCRQGKIWKGLKEVLEDCIEELLTEEGLKDWFNRPQGGWVNCRTGGPCGRKKAGRGARQKYPACRPTMAQCKPGAVKRKKSGKRISWADQRKKKGK